MEELLSICMQFPGGTTPYTINVYLSSNNDYLRPTEAFFIGSLKSATTEGEVVELDLPKALTPVPQVGAEVKNTAPMYLLTRHCGLLVKGMLMYQMVL